MLPALEAFIEEQEARWWAEPVPAFGGLTVPRPTPYRSIARGSLTRARNRS
jgi:hypothetical protein